MPERPPRSAPSVRECPSPHLPDVAAHVGALPENAVVLVLSGGEQLARWYEHRSSTVYNG
ncbi:hypothetical protein [Rhodococcus sp. NPDC003322]